MDLLFYGVHPSLRSQVDRGNGRRIWWTGERWKIKKRSVIVDNDSAICCIVNYDQVIVH
jgi:hypothetical protein